MRRLVPVLMLVGCAAVGSAPRDRIAAARDRIAAAETASGGAVEDRGEPIAVESAATKSASAPTPKTCREALADRGVVFGDAAPSKTVRDPVKLAPTLGGVVFRHQSDATPRYLWVDCRFALRLHEAAGLLSARGVREVVHVGTYEPKCNNGGTPDTNPDCAPSAHALGMAIDIVSVKREREGLREELSFEKDFVKRRDRTPTCTMPRDSERDAFLKDLVCALDGTFNAILTPNWDERHRTHAHLALHPTAKAFWASGVDPLLAPE